MLTFLPRDKDFSAGLGGGEEGSALRKYIWALSSQQSLVLDWRARRYHKGPSTSKVSGRYSRKSQRKETALKGNRFRIPKREARVAKSLGHKE